METVYFVTVGVLFTILGLACVATVVIGLPGAWMLLGLAVLVELVDGAYLSDAAPRTFGWWLLAGCTALALVGEGLELVAGALGAKRGGSSRRGAIGAFIGGIVGAVLGLGIPVPIVGPLIGAVAGTFAGAIIGETTGHEPQRVEAAVRPATAATIGRVLGTLSKVPIAVAIWAVLAVAVFWP